MESNSVWFTKEDHPSCNNKLHSGLTDELHQDVNGCGCRAFYIDNLLSRAGYGV